MHIEDLLESLDIDVVEFTEVYIEELHELFETGSVTVMVHDKEYEISLTVKENKDVRNEKIDN